MNEPMTGEGHSAKRSSKPRSLLKKLAVWFAGITVFLVVTALALHGAWLIWATISSNRAISALKAAGEPTTPETLQPAIPAGHNAFDDLTEAAEKLQRVSAPRERLEQVNSPIDWPMHRIESQRIRRYLDEYADVESLIRLASAAPVNVTTRVLTSPMLLQEYPELSNLRDVAYYQKYRAFQALEAGQSDQALNRLAEIEPVAVGAASNATLVSWLMSVGCRAMQADAIIQTASDLRIGSDPGAASPEQVRQLIASLLDDRAIVAEMHSAFRGERVMVIDGMQAVDNGNMLGPDVKARPLARLLQRYVMRPAIRSSIVAGIEQTSAAIATVPAANWPTAKAQLGQIPKPGFTDFFARLFVPGYHRAFEARYQILTDRRLAAIALASRWFLLEHGRFAEKWSDLVPAYLPNIPSDLFTDGQPIQARFSGEQSLFWSVGQDGKDDQADEMTRYGISHSWHAPDRVLHLTHLPREYNTTAQRQFDFDPDALISDKPPTTLPTTQMAASVQTSEPIAWDEMVRLDVWGGPNAIEGLRTRRDVIAALYQSAEDPEPEAATQPADPAKEVVEGIVTFEKSALRFRFTADGTLTLSGEDGAAVRFRWKPYVWEPAKFNNQWWR